MGGERESEMGLVTDTTLEGLEIPQSRTNDAKTTTAPSRDHSRLVMRGAPSERCRSEEGLAEEGEEDQAGSLVRYCRRASASDRPLDTGGAGREKGLDFLIEAVGGEGESRKLSIGAI